MVKNYFKLIVALVFVSNVMAQNVPSYVPTNGLVGWWPFNGNANDESGNGNNGTVNGATLTEDRNGKAKSAYDFNNIGDIQVSNIQFQNFLISGFTISYWFTMNDSTSTNGDRNFLITNYDGVNGLAIEYDPNTKSTLRHMLRTASSNPSEINYHQPFEKFNTWKNVTFIWTTSKKMLTYVNGVLTNTTSGENITNLSVCCGITTNFGSMQGSSSYHNGKLDDIAIYNRALTQQEITALYNGGNINSAKVGEFKYGGVIAYILGPNDPKYDPTKTQGIVSYDKDLGISNWGCYGNTLKGPSKDKDQPFFLEIGGGNLNTDSIVRQCKDLNSAAYKCSNLNINGYSDWYLPSINELKLLYNKKDIIGGFQTENYWSSTQDDIPNGNSSIYAWRLDFKDGTTHTTGSYKNNNYNVRPIRFFSENINSLASTKVFVDAPATVNQNQELELSISTESLNTADNVIAYQTDFSYDTTRYTYVGNNLTGTLNPSANAAVNNTKNGKLAISYMSQTALNGAGSLVKLKFKANNTLGQGVFGLSNFLYNTTAVTSLKSDTVNTIDVTPPTAKITYSQNPARKGDSLLITVKFNEKMAISPVPQLNLTGQNTLANTNLTKVNDTTYTYWWVVEKGNGGVNVNLATGKDLGGNVIVATPTQNPSFTVLPTVFGDIDTNKLVQAYDAALALQYSVGLNPLPTMDPLPWSNWRLAVANVDTVGNVTANDASIILQHSAKLISTFPADAKKRGGDAPTANVSVTQEGNQLVFRATGTLYAFNVFMKDHFNVLGQPEVKDKSAMVASNLNTTTYNVGLASTTPFAENEPFLVIPILTNENVQGTMDIVANTQEKSLSYGKAAGITAINKEVVIVYPNPTKDVVTINNSQGKTLRIVDVQGKEVYNQKVIASSIEVSMKTFGSKGMYLLHILDANNESIQTKQIVLE